jgi:class 3 adenylate cyclase/tetratricopeptide (TPR) repeat protein
MTTTIELARRLAAYVPATLVRQVLAAGLPKPGEPQTLMAATLFSDISGFTGMSEELASDGPRGTEELNRVLLLTFTAMIDVIHEMGGAVSHFYGDAMSVYFPDTDGRAARRALACAQMMQRLMLSSFARVATSRPPGKRPVFNLTIKIGVGYGSCQELVVGDPATSLEFVLAGAAVDEAAAAEKCAGSGQVVASQAVLVEAGVALDTRASGGGFYLLETTLPRPEARPILEWTDYEAAELTHLAEVVMPFIPPAINRRLQTAHLGALAEHRPVASLFVEFDYAGDDDESSAIETATMGSQLQRYYRWASAVVARFGRVNARVNRVLTGDKGNQLHIIFGAPVAPDAPDQAIRCALALQRERPDFIAGQRLGLAAGKVFAGPVGAADRCEYTVVGDVVNLSARLAQLCPDGAVWIDPATAERVRQWIDCEALPPVQLKGRQTTVAPCQVQGERTVATQLQSYIDRWERPLVGREKELDLLLGAMDAALRGVGGVGALIGPTGVGKSRLLAAGVKQWLAAGGTGLVGVCHQHTTDIPFGPWRSIWGGFFGLQPGMSAAAQAAAVVERTQALAPDSGDEVGLWGEVLGLPIPQSAGLAGLAAEVRQARLFSLVRRCFQAAVRAQPLLIIMEGLHWADQSTLALLDEVAQNLEESPLFLALTFRPLTELSLEVLNRPACVPIIVSDLSPGHARRLLQHLVGTAELPLPVEQHLGLRDREGRDSPVNPLFLEEALKVMTTAGVLETNGRLRVNEKLLDQVQIPDTIHGLLLARLDRLPPAGRDLLQVASVIGRQFALEPLNAITGHTSLDGLVNLLTQLSEAEMTRLVMADPEWIYLFQHAMTHEVAYESLPYARRQTLHAAVADWIQERHGSNLKPYHPVLAYHYSRAGIHEQGLRYALMAADEARGIFANKEATELYTLAEGHLKALDVEVHWETAVHLYLSRGEALRFLGDFNAAVVDVGRAIDLSLKHSSPLWAAQAHNLMAELRYRQARFDEAKILTWKVIRELAATISSDELARAYQISGTTASVLGEYELALAHLSEAEKLCTATHNNSRLARVLEAIAFVYYQQKKLELALQAMQQSVTLSRDFNVTAHVASALNNIALVQLQLGQAEDALATVNETVELARGISRNFLARFLGNRAEVFAYLGRMSEAHADFEDAIDLFAAMDDEQGLLEVYLTFGYEYHCVLGQWKEARKCLEQVQQLIDLRPENYPEQHARLLIAWGQVELQDGSLTSAEGYFTAAEELIADKELTWWRPVVLYFRALTEMAKGATTTARSQLQRALKAVSEGGCTDYLPLILVELAQVEVVAEKRLAYMEECIETADRRARHFDRIQCFKKASSILIQSTEPHLQKLGRAYLARVAELQLIDTSL